MGSSYFGDPNMGGGGGGSSGRKSKKSNSSERTKPPQRGLGVAQLEKIRLGCNYHQYPPSLHSPNYPPNFNQEDVMRVQTAGYSSIPSSSSFSYATSSSSAASSASYGFQRSIMMGGLGEYERAPTGYGDSQPNSTPSWNPGIGIYGDQHHTQPNSLEPMKNKKHQRDSIDSSQNSDSSNAQEPDLELRLSL